MAKFVVNPNADPESTSVDGYCSHTEDGATWATLVAGAGTGADDSAILAGIAIYASATTNRWLRIWRGILLFDTSSLPSDTVIQSATLSIYGINGGKADNLNILPNINVYSSNPASNTSLAAGDYDSLGSTAFCDTAITYVNWVENGWNDFVLNSSGIAAININGITKLGLRNANYDVAGVIPAWSANNFSNLEWITAEETNKPKLTINYSAFIPKIFYF